MNSLSWMVYFAEICDNLGFALHFWGAGGLLLCIGIILLFMISEGDYPKSWKGFWYGLVIGNVCLFLSVFVPSKNTFYAIAASQVGEKIAQNEGVQGLAKDSLTALRSWLKSQTEPKK